MLRGDFKTQRGVLRLRGVGFKTERARFYGSEREVLRLREGGFKAQRGRF